METKEITVPVISLWQPWASAVVTPHPRYPGRGMKEYETRSWTTKVRGRILIHAAKKNVPWDVLSHFGHIADNLLLVHGGKLPVGAIIGSVEIEDIITSEHFYKNGSDLSKTPIDEYHWGDWEPNRFGWKLTDPVSFEQPILWKGQQGFWKLPIMAIPEQYRAGFTK